MAYFSIIELDGIKKRYATYIRDFRKIQSHEQYEGIIRDFLRNMILGKVESSDYSSIFSPERIIGFHAYRKSAIVRAAILSLAEMFKKEGLLPEKHYFEYPEIEKPSKRQSTFLSLEELKFLLSDRISFADDGERIAARLVYLFPLFCYFDQKDMMSLTLSDIVLEERLIRNMRKNESRPHLLQWIEMNDLIFERLNDYLKYRENINTNSDKLILVGGQPAKTENLNALFNVFKRIENIKFLERDSINAQLLIRSMFFFSMVSSKGQSISQILRVHEWNKYFEDALKEYLKSYSQIDNQQLFGKRDVYLMSEFNGIINGLERVEKIINDEIEDRDPDGNSELGEGKYSEEKDITMADLLDFDGNGTQNHKETNIVIQRLVRDSKIAKILKAKYGHTCQLCEYQLRSSNGGYTSEAHHIKPYNRTHRGDDTIKNIIVLCPNCHTQFDEFYYAINPDTLEVHCLYEDDRFHLSTLRWLEGHSLGDNYLRYSWDIFLGKKVK